MKGLPGVGPETIKKIGESDPGFIPDTALLERLKACSRSAKAKSLTQGDIGRALDSAEDVLKKSADQGISVTSWYEKDFPDGLRHALNTSGKKAPAILVFYKGDLSLASSHGVAVIGARKCAPQAAAAGRAIAEKLAARGFCIVSGLALGCDTAAHEGALNAHDGKTIAILGNGLDDVYPKENKLLAERILERGGLLLSEYEIGTPALNYNLVARDRLQAALSLATIVLQTSPKGGTMNAALSTHHAGRPLYAVRYSDASVNGSPETEGNHLLVSKYKAQYIGGYRNMTEMDEDMDRVSESIRQKSLGSCPSLEISDSLF